MAKKLGRLALFGVLAGAAAAGTYYYLQKKHSVLDDEFDDFDDFDDFDEDLDDDLLEESGNNTNTSSAKAHAHIPIDLDSAKEIIGEKVIETLDKTKEKLEQLNVPEKLDKAKEMISDRISPSVSSEPVYTEMDMSTSSSAAYSDTEKTETSDSNPATESFFDDSENK